MSQKVITNHIGEIIEQVMEYRDQGHWVKLEEYFTEKPYIDDEVITKEKPGLRPVALLMYTWRKLTRELFYSGKHRVSDIRVERLNKKEVAAESDIEARFYTTKDSKRYVLKVVGVYKYTFRKVAGRWKISDMRLAISRRSFEPLGA
jgi:SnoaL-like domain